MINAGLAFQDYIRSSNLLPFDRESHVGCWKNLTVRTSSSGEVMLILLIFAKELTPEQLQEVKNSLTATFSNLENPKIVSFFLIGEDNDNPLLL